MPPRTPCAGACSPGMTRTAAICRGAAPRPRRAARSLSGVAVGDHAAADHGRRRRALFPRSPPAGRASTTLAARRTRRGDGRGRASATTPAPATCYAPARWRASMGGVSRRPKACAAAGHRPLYGGRRRGHRLRQPATAVDGNVERVMARLFAVETPLPAAKPELKALTRRWCRRRRRGFRPGADGPGRHHLPCRAAPCKLCPWPRLPRRGRRASPEPLPRRAQARAAAAPRRRLRGRRRDGRCCCAAARRRGCWAG